MFYNLLMIVVYSLYLIQGLMFDSGAHSPLPNGFPNTENCPPTRSLFRAGTEHCSVLSGWWVIVANWVWIFTFIAAPVFIPPEPHMMESYHIIEDDEEPYAGIQMH